MSTHKIGSKKKKKKITESDTKFSRQEVKSVRCV